MTHERFVAFLRAVSASEDGEHFANANVIAAFEAKDIGSRIVIDTTSRSKDGAWFTIYLDDAAPPAEVTFAAPAETFDRVLLGDLDIMLAIASRKIVAEGKVARAMRLVPAFRRSLPHYLTSRER